MVKIKAGREITDEVAISIRRLWHIESMEEKKKLIKHYDNLYRLFLLVKNRPELFKPDELEKYKKKRQELTQAEEDLISEIFVALHMGLISVPVEYSVEEMEDYRKKGLYFTKEELDFDGYEIVEHSGNEVSIKNLPETDFNFANFVKTPCFLG